MKHLFYAFGFLLMVVVVTVAADRAGVFIVRDVQVVIDNTTVNPQVFADQRDRLLSELSHLQGVKIWQIPLRETSRALNATDWIADAQIFRRLPNRIEVRVMPKAIELIYLNDKNQMHPVASDGSLLAPLANHQIPDLPILRGHLLGESSDLRKMAVSLIEQLPVKGRLTVHGVSEVSYSERDGFALILRQKSAKVQLGHDDFKRKSARVSQVMAYLESHAIESRLIDASFARKVLVRTKKSSTP